MASTSQHKFSSDDFEQADQGQPHPALRALDVEIGKSKNMSKIAPIQLLSAGGFVAVTLFHNRVSTEDLDYIMNPDTPGVDKIKQKLQIAIEAVCRQRELPADWINSQMEIFAIGANKQRLFRDSVTQNVVLWRGANLVIYAAQWEWSLARKLKRVGSQYRLIDISDAVEILYRMVEENGGPLALETVKSWDTIVYTPLDMDAIKYAIGATIFLFWKIAFAPSWQFNPRSCFEEELVVIIIADFRGVGSISSHPLLNLPIKRGDERFDKARQHSVSNNIRVLGVCNPGQSPRRLVVVEEVGGLVAHHYDVAAAQIFIEPVERAERRVPETEQGDILELPDVALHAGRAGYVGASLDEHVVGGWQWFRLEAPRVRVQQLPEQFPAL
ncbi:hypothetical protein CCM_09266 [Cordyceps militaris CM01]|uniref:Uncharacterized protein n=1 Tax=Cordyceps militaris (strain CM01) TaxID=983644 RepID=G3JTX6_CORMM|nr:uncharacterized protein CCM_09266 [Cordyceps militaris CM01]EGX88130.1 hypothetical protein CCM_09266 [Cordyceps militaris CM01]